MITHTYKKIITALTIGFLGNYNQTSLHAMEKTLARKHPPREGISFQINNKVSQFIPDIDKIIVKKSIDISLNSVLRTCKSWNKLAYQYTTQLYIRDKTNYDDWDSDNKSFFCYDNSVLAFRKLRNLRLGDCEKITNKFLSTLINLTHLSLDKQNPMYDWPLMTFTNLTHLNLYENNRITGKGIETLTNLRTLNLSCKSHDIENIGITDKSLKQLKSLTDLNLANNTTITDFGLRPLVQLRRLDLASNTLITGQALKTLTNLTCLILNTNNKLTNEDLSPLKNLKELHLHNNPNITIEGIKSLKKLTHLYLGGKNLFTDAKVKKLTNLTLLNLKNNDKITDKGICNLTKLTSLDLSSNKIISSDGIKGLLNLKYLKYEHNKNNILTPEVLKNLTKLRNREALLESQRQDTLNKKDQLILEAMHFSYKGDKAYEIIPIFENYQKSIVLYSGVLTMDLYQADQIDYDNYEGEKLKLLSVLNQYLENLDQMVYSSK